MVVCGDNALAQRLTKELATVYGQHVCVVLPSLRGGDHGPRIAALVGAEELSVRAVEAQIPDDAALRAAGVREAAALALTSGDDQLNIHIALRARRLNPQLRLVIRMFNRTLGSYLENLLDRAVEVAHPDLDAAAIDASTTVLSDADTAAPSLVAAAVVGSDKIVSADGLLLRAKERTIGTRDRHRQPLCTLAVLPDTTDSGAGEGDTDEDPDGGNAPVLLPDDAALHGLPPDRGAVVLEAITRRPSAGGTAGRLPRLLPFQPLKELFSRRLRYSLAAMGAVLTTLAAVNWWMSGGSPVNAAYVVLLDFFAINDPKVNEPADEQLLQLLAGMAGLMMLPLLLAVVLESYGAFRKAAALPDPPRGLSGHVVLLGLGKVGTRVLDRLLELGIPVVCIERDHEARGIAYARSRRVPTLIADVTESGVLEDAKIKRSRALLALTSDDGINLEAVLYARQVKPELRVAMRLFDDEFATTVYRTLRDTYPLAQTRSRSVSALAAPAFAGAMMGRQVLGAIPVGRRVLVFAAVDVRDNPLLEGRTVDEAFHAGTWRVLALDVSEPGGRRSELSWMTSAEMSGLEWELHPGYVLRPDDRVVVAATRRGLGALLAAGPDAGPPPIAGTGPHRIPAPPPPPDSGG
ncbi:potassium transporter TrkA [Streptomyces armeniacus]|uniref:Potassium transporter TrkA n=1 Tax=Streptomyces armeniacus TaxID=83291 RepID=A0A345Y0N3_9ACTN|nr:NAD-binding protein [Streptomyces armeniacus]AXK37449.1 potassium transporter TrkA [Streptomyces armeniacus]